MLILHWFNTVYSVYSVYLYAYYAYTQHAYCAYTQFTTHFKHACILLLSFLSFLPWFRPVTACVEEDQAQLAGASSFQQRSKVLDAVVPWATPVVPLQKVGF